jgi:hypothetical protein
MNVRDLVGRAGPLIGELGGRYYFAPRSLERAAELGLDVSQWYFLGRGGPLGEVEAASVDAVLGYFAPGVVRDVWERGCAVASPKTVAMAHLEACREFGRQHLRGKWLQPFCDTASAVLDASNIAALPLFAAVKTMRIAEDLPGRAMQLTTALREFRGGVHLLAIVATGLEPRVAHWLTRPDVWENFGYSADDVPRMTDDARELLSWADDLTDRLMLPAFSVLSDRQAVAMLEGLESMKAMLPEPEFPG